MKFNLDKVAWEDAEPMNTMQDSADRPTVVIMNARVLDRRRRTGTKDVAIVTPQMDVALEAL